MKQHFSRIVSCFIVLGTALLALGQDAPEQEARQLAEKAQQLAKSKKFDEAAATIKKAIELAPRNDLYLAFASDYETKAGNYAAGLDYAQKALKLNDKTGAYWTLASAAALGMQDLDKAREYCDEILKRGNEFGEAVLRDGRILQDLLSKKTYTLHWTLDPQRGKLERGAFAVAMPKDKLPYQTCTYEISGAKSARLIKGEVNDILYIVPQGTKPITLTTKVTVIPYSFKKELAKAGGTVPAEARAYLGPFLAVNPKSPVLTKVAAGLKGTNNVETARNILAWMKKNIEYKLTSTPIDKLDFTNVDELVERGHAECRGQAMLFTALCRAAGVPARPIWGLTRVSTGQDQRYGDIASHNWSEIYVPGSGWIPVDPQRPETLGCLPTSCIRIFMDERKSRTQVEALPIFNLLSMNGDKLKFDEARTTP